MRREVVDRGSSERVCVLLHGMIGSAESWWRVSDRLVESGYRVIWVDLPGHGLSPRDHELTVERAAAAVVETVSGLVAEAPVVAIGHSFGGVVLAAAASGLQPRLAVYVDAPFASRGGHDRAEDPRRRSLGLVQPLRRVCRQPARGVSVTQRAYDTARRCRMRVCSGASGGAAMPTCSRRRPRITVPPVSSHPGFDCAR
jgi:alpha-beta hydrolase superfamily lysophospholipase